MYFNNIKFGIFLSYLAFIILLKAHVTVSVKLDVVDCGVDNQVTVAEGDVKLSKYPWLGVLYYKFWGESGDSKAVTTVALIHSEFVIGPAAAIGPMPKANFRQKTRVLLGEGWSRPGRRVRNYVLHPEYGETYNTVCLVQLKDVVRSSFIKPLCPPAKILKDPEFFVVKIKDDFKILEKEVIKVMHIPGKMCKDFYVAANLYSKMMRPPHVACAVALRTSEVCVWNAGAALVSRDVWGRWQLLGIGVRGPGCGAPSRYLDMMTYYPWIEHSLAQFEQITISRISSHKYVIRAGSTVSPHIVGEREVTRFGNCDDEERQHVLYREAMSFRTNVDEYKHISYNAGYMPSFFNLRYLVNGSSIRKNKVNVKELPKLRDSKFSLKQRYIYTLTIFQEVEFTCLTLELVNASGSAEMQVRHICDRNTWDQPCYRYKSSRFDISVGVVFFDSCIFEMVAYGLEVNMSLLDIQMWKWQEGEYYDDFTIQRVEYRGPAQMTEFGYEPLDLSQWIPAYDLWTTTDPSQRITKPTHVPAYLPITVYKKTNFTTTTTRSTTTRTKRKPKLKTKTTTTTKPPW